MCIVLHARLLELYYQQSFKFYVLKKEKSIYLYRAGFPLKLKQIKEENTPSPFVDKKIYILKKN